MTSKSCGEIKKIKREKEQNVYIMEPFRSQSGWIVSPSLDHVDCEPHPPMLFME